MKGRTWRAGIRYRLHRCMSCRKRGIYTLTMTAEDANGDPVGEPIKHRICGDHAETPDPHELRQALAEVGA